MRYRFLVLVVLLVANASMAQKDLLSCVVPDIRGVLLPETIAPPFSCAVPDELAGLELPADPVFIGSIEGLYRRIALYRSALAPGEAVDAVTAALHDKGWRDLAIDALTGSGFVMGGPAAAPAVVPGHLHVERAGTRVRCDDGSAPADHDESPRDVLRGFAGQRRQRY